MKSLKFVCLVFLYVASLLASGCSNKEAPNYTLKDSAPKLDAEAERLRQMQMVRVIKQTEDPNDPENGKAEEWDEVGIAQAIKATCVDSPSSEPISDCAGILELGKIWYCSGELYLAMASGAQDALLSFNSNGVRVNYKVPPQSTATGAKLAGGAVRKFQDTLLTVAQILSGQPSPGWVTCHASDLTQAQARESASLFIDSYQKAKKAYEIMSAATLSVSDAQLASTPNFQTAAARSMAGVELSRAALAHDLVGGKDGIYGSTAKAMCASGRLSGPAKRALDIIRESGVSPADVLQGEATLPTAQLLNGPAAGASALPDGTVRQRLEDVWGTSFPTSQTIEDFYGLKTGDFLAARAYLQDEIKAFSRSTTAQLPKRAFGGGRIETYARFSGTTTPPADLPAAYWMAVALSEGPVPNTYVGGDTYDTDYDTNIGSLQELQSTSWAFPRNTTISQSDNISLSFAGLADYAKTWASVAAARPTLQSFFTDEMVKPLLTLAAGSDVQGRITQCYKVEYPQNQTIMVFGFKMTDGLALVSGEDDLRCAVYGTVEGAPCSLTGSSLVNFTDPVMGGPEFPDGVSRGFDTTSLSTRERLYVLQPRAGVTDPKPGDYVALAGFVPYTSTRNTWSYANTICREFPIVPEAIEATAKALAPSRQWCGESSTMCDGSRFDDRIPLEDELTDDGDGVESSWKHYLALAKEAAAESDALGKEYVDASLSKDQRAETLSLRVIDQQQRAAAELDKLQQICGTAVNPERILAVMTNATAGGYDLSTWQSEACNPSSPTEAAAHLGWKCVGGYWVKTWARVADELADKDPEVAKLRQCIRSADDTKPYVHLGDAPLCLSATQVQVPSALDCGTDVCGTGFTCVSKDDGLKLFSTRATMPVAPGLSLCDQLRELRKKPAARNFELPEDLDVQYQASKLKLASLADPFLNTGNLRELTRGLDVRLDYNDHITVSASGAQFSTGSTGQPNTTRWPCTSTGAATNCSAGTGLFCQVANCTDSASRGAVTRRLYLAALAAKLITWTTGDEKPSIDVPVWIDSDLDPTTTTSKAPSGLLVGSVPIEVWTSAKWRTFYLADGITDANAQRATSVGADGTNFLSITATLGPSDRAQPYTFGLTRVELQPQDLLSAYWAGLGATSGNKGYLWKIFNGYSHGQAKPAEAKDMQMPGAIAVRVQQMYNNMDPTLAYNDPEAIYYIDGEVVKGSSIFPQRLALAPSKRPAESASFYTDENVHATPATAGNLQPMQPARATIHPVDSPKIGGAPWKYDYSKESILDGLELLCEAGLRQSGQSRSSCGPNDTAPQLNRVSDMSEMGSYLQCLGDDIRRRAATATFTDFPASVVAELQSSTQGAFQTASGTIADSISQLRIALTDVAQSGPTIGREVQTFGQDLKDLQAALVIYDTTKKINDVQYEATQTQQITNCFTESMKATGVSSFTSLSGAAAIATCANSFAQIGFAEKLRTLGNEMNQAQRETAIGDFNKRFIDHATALQRESLRLSSALETVRRVLGEIESERQAARRSIESAMWLLSAQATNTPAINNVTAALSETARIRYLRAFSNAKHMAFLAKRAIEQRLGLSLNEITEELPLVDAPSNWAPKVCDTSGIDYASLADGTSKNFADSFIGDYVKKLENVVESYRLKHNFHEGRDTAIVSLRDDVMNLRANCSVTSPNLLLYASDLEHVDPVSPSTQPGWRLTGCNVDSSGLALPDCVTTTRSPYIPLRVRPFEQAPILGYSLKFGNGGTCTAPTCGWKDGAGLSQTVDLTPGMYRFSWYTRDAFSIAGGNWAAVGVVDASGNAVTRLNADVLPGNGDTWNRLYFTFDIAESGPVTVTFKNPGGIYPVQLAAPMLERVDDPTFSNSSPEPKVFSDTTDQRTMTLPVCEDTSGTLFRGVWTRGCEKLCPDGFASDCRERAQTHCYRQTSFDLSQRTAETGQLFKAAGFALGNFNYRIESLALNFVGTGLRNCGDSNLPTTCNAAGFVPYTLIHEGPYFVRNYQGVDFLANLFAGRIERARGLATERYLTNPVSSSDQSLLEAFVRTEFRGRPLDGSFILRVWDEDSAAFDAVQDVQIALTYRYWTRFN